MTAAVPLARAPPAQPPRLFDQLRDAARAAGQSASWIEPLTSWATAFIVFHGKRHPRDLDAAARDAFPRDVAQTRHDPLAALSASRLALRLLYEEVLHQPVGELAQPRPPRLLDPMRQVLRRGHYSRGRHGTGATGHARFPREIVHVPPVRRQQARRSAPSSHKRCLNCTVEKAPYGVRRFSAAFFLRCRENRPKKAAVKRRAPKRRQSAPFSAEQA
jgi:hypothetical protein